MFDEQAVRQFQLKLDTYQYFLMENGDQYQAR